MQKEFGKLRSFFWPIYRHEVAKLLPMFSIFFLLSFVYNLLRPVKQSIVLNAPGDAGAEVIPFLKVWAVLPMALILAYGFTLLANRFSRDKVFYITVTFFLSFFLLFAVFLYPNLEQVQLSYPVDVINSILPQRLQSGLRGLFLLVRYWPLTLFYCFCELWGTVILTMLFWGFANEVTKVEEAKRFYSFYSISGNSSGMLAGYIGSQVSCSSLNYIEQYTAGMNHWEVTLLVITCIVVIMGLASMVIYYYYINSEHLIEYVPSKIDIKKKQDKLSLRECFAYVYKFRYLSYIAVLVVAYNMVFHMSDVLWSQELKRHFASDKNAMNAFTSIVTAYTGLAATLVDLLITGNILRRYGWTVTALMTPIVLMITMAIFSVMLLVQHEVIDFKFAMYTMLGNPTLSLPLIFGTIQIISTRACKYTVFDASKEMAYIPLGKEGIRKGKTVIDMIGSRLGKSGGAVVLQLIIVLFGLSSSTYLVIGMIFIFAIFWILSVRALGKEINLLARRL